ncbi:histidine kinase [Pengzhenrongella phosphoraccumulans]|uniref:histidine kinase n=1 Tax=Pengzhenrongella phosphoraccumulans TaxID=3114394 RepID=UPI00388E9C13
MDLSVAERRLDNDPAAARELLGQARVQAAEALAELRALSRAIASTCVRSTRSIRV